MSLAKRDISVFMLKFCVEVVHTGRANKFSRMGCEDFAVLEF